MQDIVLHSSISHSKQRIDKQDEDTVVLPENIPHISLLFLQYHVSKYIRLWSQKQADVIYSNC
jgi:hypothetical protein